jgi:Fur family zinc uptake transcriptional regulator
MPAPLPASGESDRTPDTALAQRRARGRLLTPLRQTVLDLLLAAARPIGAYALLEQLRAIHPQSAAPTVYRALAFLVEEGFAHRIERLNAYIAAGKQQAHPGAAPVAGSHQFLICDRCGHTTQLQDPLVAAALASVMQRLGFVGHVATIELQGLCAACAAAGMPGGTLARPPG